MPAQTPSRQESRFLDVFFGLAVRASAPLAAAAQARAREVLGEGLADSTIGLRFEAFDLAAPVGEREATRLLDALAKPDYVILVLDPPDELPKVVLPPRLLAGRPWASGHADQSALDLVIGRVRGGPPCGAVFVFVVRPPGPPRPSHAGPQADLERRLGPGARVLTCLREQVVDTLGDWVGDIARIERGRQGGKPIQTATPGRLQGCPAAQEPGPAAKGKAAGPPGGKSQPAANNAPEAAVGPAPQAGRQADRGYDSAARLVCPRCGASSLVRLDARDAGQIVRCPRCGAILRPLRHASPAQASPAPAKKPVEQVQAGPGVKLPQHGPGVVDENVQFTVYRPRAVCPNRWYPMLAFAHLAERPPDAPPDMRDPMAEVRRQAAATLGEEIKDFSPLTQDAQAALPREGEITMVPEVEGLEFNPPRRTFRWTEEPVHREEFRLRARAAMDGRTARGRLTVWLGALIVGDVPLAIAVTSNILKAKEPAPMLADSARPYHRIFASYSHQDDAIVRHIEYCVETLGHRYLRDCRDLRSGEEWSPAIAQLIERADLFQLFWSWNSMRSSYVRQEYEYALDLGRPRFVRPTYWEEPRPEDRAAGLPPAELDKIQFSRFGGGPVERHGVAGAAGLGCRACKPSLSGGPAPELRQGVISVDPEDLAALVRKIREAEAAAVARGSSKPSLSGHTPSQVDGLDLSGFPDNLAKVLKEAAATGGQEDRPSAKPSLSGLRDQALLGRAESPLARAAKSPPQSRRRSLSDIIFTLVLAFLVANPVCFILRALTGSTWTSIALSLALVALGGIALSLYSRMRKRRPRRG